VPAPCAAEIEPSKTILFEDEARLGTMSSRRPIAVGLGPDYLAARSIARSRSSGSRDWRPRLDERW
jgi:hypothetical protein